jgi:hypothetical protein
MTPREKYLASKQAQAQFKESIKNDWRIGNIVITQLHSFTPAPAAEQPTFNRQNIYAYNQ